MKKIDCKGVGDNDGVFELENTPSTILATVDTDLIFPVDLIVDVTNSSDSYTQRARIFFSNGYQLSIVRGKWTYGGKQGLFEIAAFDRTGEMDGDLIGIGDNVVKGFVTLEQVNEYILKIANLT